MVIYYILYVLEWIRIDLWMIGDIKEMLKCYRDVKRKFVAVDTNCISCISTVDT